VETEVVNSILHNLQYLPFLRNRFVRSHQKGPNLSLAAIFNNRSDVLATAARELCTRPTESPIHDQSTATLFIRKVEVSTKLQESLRNAAYSPEMRQYMTKKYNWNLNTVDEIDWYVHGGALRGLTPAMKKTTTQFIHEWLPTNAHPGRAESVEAKKCPYCQEDDETQTHYLRCPHELVDTQWQEHKEKIEAALTKGKTHPVLHDLIIRAVLEWRTTSKPTVPRTLPRDLLPLFTAQSEIGWDQVIKGRLSTQWVDKQNEQFKSLNLAPGGEQWAIRIVKSIWTLHLSCTLRSELRNNSEITKIPSGTWFRS
jgi:hypothetical protein